MKIIREMIKREYMLRVRRRSFFVATLLAPFGLLLYAGLPVLFLFFGGGERKVTMLDQSGDPTLFEAIKTAAEKERSGTRFNLSQQVVMADENIDEIRARHNAEMESNSDFACIVLRKEVFDGQPPEYYASHVTDLSLTTLGRFIQSAITERRLVRAGLDPASVGIITNQPEMKTIRVSGEGESQDSGQNFVVTLVFLMVIYFTIVGYSSTVANGVSEERESRIIEVLITSVEPHQIMISKLVGIGMVGLTQYALWGLLGAAIALPANLLLGRAGFRIPSIPASLLGYSVIFFLLGYFLFGTINLIVGAMASKPEDVTMISRPLGLINILPWFLYYLVMKDPNGTAAVTLSMIPFLAPTLMMVRIVVSATPVSHILLSIFIMLLSIAFVLWVASKVYRARILIYGKRVTLAELGRWLRHS